LLSYQLCVRAGDGYKPKDIGLSTAIGIYRRDATFPRDLAESIVNHATI
jgi:hypothetical protein